MKKKLTDGFVSIVKPLEGRDEIYWDNGTSSVVGLGLKVTKTGKKSFVFQYRAGVGRSAKIKRIGLGAPSSSNNVKAVRKVASEHSVTVANGGDPAANIRKAKLELNASKNRTFEGFLDAEFIPYINENMRTAHEIERIIRREFLALWKNRDIADIGRVEIREQLHVRHQHQWNILG